MTIFPIKWQANEQLLGCRKKLVYNWLVGLQPYKRGIFGIITFTDPPNHLWFLAPLRHPTKGRSTVVRNRTKTNQPPAVAFRGSKIPKGLSPQFCQAKGDFQTNQKRWNGHKTGTMQGTQRNSQKIWGPHHSHLWKFASVLYPKASKVRKKSMRMCY